MGFLDFLKKDKPAPSMAAPSWNPDMPPLPPSGPASMPPPPPVMPLPLEQPPITPTYAPSAPLSSPSFPPAEASWAQDPLPPKPAATSAWTSEPAALDTWAPQNATAPAAPAASMSSPAAAPAAPAPLAPAAIAPLPPEPATPIELPDFTDEELAEIEQISAPLPVLPEAKPAKLPELPKVKLVSEEPVVAAPANAVALPPDEILLPLGEEVKVAALEPAKFISSQSYLTILADVKTVRKSLRTGDDIVKDVTLRHEQLDLQYKRVAADINSIQEHFIKIDGALFEE